MLEAQTVAQYQPAVADAVDPLSLGIVLRRHVPVFVADNAAQLVQGEGLHERQAERQRDRPETEEAENARVARNARVHLVADEDALKARSVHACDDAVEVFEQLGSVLPRHAQARLGVTGQQQRFRHDARKADGNGREHKGELGRARIAPGQYHDGGADAKADGHHDKDAAEQDEITDHGKLDRFRLQP